MRDKVLVQVVQQASSALLYLISLSYALKEPFQNKAIQDAKYVQLAIIVNLQFSSLFSVELANILEKAQHIACNAHMGFHAVTQDTPLPHV